MADNAAKQAAEIAIESQSESQESQSQSNKFGLSISDEAQHLSSNLIEDELLKQWNKQWIKPIDKNIHKHCKKILPTISFARDLFYKLLVTLQPHELKIISRLISGHVNLRYYMNLINIYNDPYCRNCGYYAAQQRLQQEQNQNKNKSSHWSDKLLLLYKFDDDTMIKRIETIEHYLFKCNGFNKQRNALFNNIFISTSKDKYKISNNNQITLQLLLTGYPCKNWKIRKQIVKHTISFVKQTKRMNI